MNINIIENNANVRNVLRKIIWNIDNSINVFSSSNGLHGLGKILISKPEMVIIDATLPEFSGYELINYLNENIIQYELFTKLAIVILDDGAITKFNQKQEGVKLSQKYVVFNKRDKKFIENFSKHLKLNFEYLDRRMENGTPKNVKKTSENIKGFRIKAFFFISQKLINIAIKREKVVFRFKGGFILNQTTLSVLLLLTFIYQSILLLALEVCAPRHRKQNIPLLQQDYKYFRTAKYSILASVILVLLFIIINLFLFVYGSVTISNNKIESIFADLEQDNHLFLQSGAHEKDYASGGEIFIVNTTTDNSDYTLNGECSIGTTTGGACTLRAAIEEANNMIGYNEIHFNIPTSDPGYINPDGSRTSTAEPPGTYTAKQDGYFLIENSNEEYQLTDNAGIKIDGYTQPNSTRNSSVIGSPFNTNLMVRIEFTNTDGTYQPIFDVISNKIYITGLNTAVTDQKDVSIGNNDPNSQNSDLLIEGNFIDVNIDGLSKPIRNQNQGIWIHNGSNIQIGTNGDGSGDRGEFNLIGGTTRTFYSTNVQISGNYIGTDKTGETCLTNMLDYDVIEFKVQNEGNIILGSNLDGLADSYESNIIGCLENSNGTLSLVRFLSYVPNVSYQINNNYIGISPGGNSIFDSGGSGLYIQKSLNSGGEVKNNNIGYSPTAPGIENNMDGVLIKNNTISFNGTSGIVNNADDVQILDNEIINNTGNGIHNFGSNLQLTNNKLNNNSQFGLYHLGNELTASQNEFNNNTLSGVHFVKGNLNFSNNTLSYNQEFGATFTTEVLSEEITNMNFLDNTLDSNSTGAVYSNDTKLITNITSQNTLTNNGGFTDFAQKIFTVNNTGDESDHTLNGICNVEAITGGACTLRAAIEEAEYLIGKEIIQFNIPSTDPGYINPDGSRISTAEPPGTYITKGNGEGHFLIEPLTNYEIFSPYGVKIDGYTQAGSSRNNAEYGEENNAEYMIQIRSPISLKFDMSEDTSNNHITGFNTNIRPSILNQASYNWVEGNMFGLEMDGDSVMPEDLGANFIYARRGVKYNIIGSNLDGVSDYQEINIITINVQMGAIYGVTWDGLYSTMSISVNNEFNMNYIGTTKNPDICPSSSAIHRFGLAVGATNFYDARVEQNVIGCIFENGSYAKANLLASSDGLIIKNNFIGISPNGEDIGLEATNTVYSTGISGGVPSYNNLPIFKPVQIDNNKIANVDGAGIMIYGYGAEITNNEIFDIKNHAIVIGGIATNEGSEVTNMLIQKNEIYNNEGAGILNLLSSANQMQVTQNSLHDNLIGIDLNTDAVNNSDWNNKHPYPNISGYTVGIDTNDPGDIDLSTKGNSLQNHPVIKEFAKEGNTLVAKLDLEFNISESPFTIEFFDNDSVQPSGYGEGKYYVGSGKTSKIGDDVFVQFTPNNYNLTNISALTSTATNSLNNTSEFSTSPQTTLFYDQVFTKTRASTDTNIYSSSQIPIYLEAVSRYGDIHKVLISLNGGEYKEFDYKNELLYELPNLTKGDKIFNIQFVDENNIISKTINFNITYEPLEEIIVDPTPSLATSKDTITQNVVVTNEPTSRNEPTPTKKSAESTKPTKKSLLNPIPTEKQEIVTQRVPLENNIEDTNMVENKNVLEQVLSKVKETVGYLGGVTIATVFIPILFIIPTLIGIIRGTYKINNQHKRKKQIFNTHEIFMTLQFGYIVKHPVVLISIMATILGLVNLVLNFGIASLLIFLITGLVYIGSVYNNKILNLN